MASGSQTLAWLHSGQTQRDRRSFNVNLDLDGHGPGKYKILINKNTLILQGLAKNTNVHSVKIHSEHTKYFT